MEKFILGKKGRMTQIFTAEGQCIPVTLIEAGPCVVTQIRTVNDQGVGYHAVQLGLEPVREKVLSKAEVGHCKKAGAAPMRHLAERRLSAAAADYEIGKAIKCDIFEAGDMVNVIGWSKGRGFAGPIKRYGFQRQPSAHGGMATRRRGSSGSNTDPGRVFKGKRMAGRYGQERFTIMNLEVVLVDAERNLLAVKGAVPGYRGSILHVCPVTPGYPTKVKKKSN